MNGTGSGGVMPKFMSVSPRLRTQSHALPRHYSWVMVRGDQCSRLRFCFWRNNETSKVHSGKSG